MKFSFDPETFRGRRILITGDTGFKGSWLALWLHRMGAKVWGFALPPEDDQAHYSVLNLGAKIQHHDGDIRNIDDVTSIFEKAKPEIVFHLAAQSLVKRSYAEPKLTFDTNFGGGVNLLEAVRGCPSVAAVVFITSDKCYFNKEWVWGYRENDELGGLDPYSASKAATELAFRAYVSSFFQSDREISIATTRAGNVIGGGDWAADRIVPDCIRALNKKAPITLRMPQATRPWQYVLEPLSGYLCLASRMLETPGKYGGAWNFGPGEDSIRTVHELTKQLIQHWDHGEIIIDQPPNQAYEATLLHLNIDKARTQLNWSPRWHVDRAIHECAVWYKSVLNGEDAEHVSLRQIESYMSAE